MPEPALPIPRPQAAADDSAPTPDYAFLLRDGPQMPHPRRDPKCERCTDPDIKPWSFNPAKKSYRRGDILQIQESVHTPIDALFTSVKKTLPGTAQSASSVRSYLNSDRKPRPGVAMESRPTTTMTNEQTYTCLMATYRGIYAFAHLPPVLKHFCVPISPHYEIEKDGTHLHTSPEWQRPHAWLIACACVSMKLVVGRWEWKDETETRRPEFSFRFYKKMFKDLDQIRAQKWDEWWQRAQEKGYLEARYMEYQAFKRQIKEANEQVK
ncbi:hypothetical protein GSI_04302 [Ganoderma sinense ZZ0214-1]|uniref:Uncharacterized protein n=1 Tax=Ganoderma sinense ZZ0214-1 TaxID=1077348 RepID=A0A2G8SJE9_9APHY|nr:hypothetical protein GSI_04302 [Ganoderma sinense ZZ0214-1]